MSYVCLLAACFPRLSEANSGDAKKGLNIDIHFNNTRSIGKTTAATGPENLLEVTRPVPYIEIKPNDLESVNRIAEMALENETLSTVMHEEYYNVMRNLGELSPEEMLSELIGQTNALEAIKAELGAEERITRLQLYGYQSVPQVALPVSTPVVLDPNAVPNYL